MIDLFSGVSRIGMGCYRMSSRVAEHRAAMARAIELGCTLFDTASNYVDGKSEELVGQALSIPSCRGAAVITKAGYLSPALRRELDSDGFDLPDTVSYSLAPDVLRVSLQTSLHRLRTRRLGALLLHNPEHLFASETTDVDAVVCSAFHFLQEQVDLGAIQCFGVSSSKFGLQAEHTEDRISLPRLVCCAREMGSSNGFRIAQMPCNLIERDMVVPIGVAGQTIQQFAAQNGLLTIANRPINALREGLPVRLARYEDSAIVGKAGDGDAALNDFVSLISERLVEIGESYTCHDFPVMRFLRDMWSELWDPGLVDQVFADQVQPFLAALYDGAPPPRVADAVKELHRAKRMQALASASRRAEAVLNEATRGTIAVGEGRPLSYAAAAFPLSVGFDHVLVGMRSRKYVEELAPMFHPVSVSPQTPHSGA
jgi:aryl-alcohol dehydrogenase-like predicted oxidoreductase